MKKEGMTQDQKFVLMSKDTNASNYVKKGRLSIAEAKRVTDKAFEVLAILEKKTKGKVEEYLLKLFETSKGIDNNPNNSAKGKNYNRPARVFSSLVAKELGLATSTVHEKLTEAVTRRNRCIASFLHVADNKLDRLEKLCYSINKGIGSQV